MQYPEDGSQFLYHKPCESCGSSDGCAVYSSGSAWCFSCETHFPGDSQNVVNINTKRKVMGLLEYEYTDLIQRRIPKSICSQYRYGIGEDRDGNSVQIANYFDVDKTIVAQKIRTVNKEFKFLGEPKKVLMFGQQLWGNKGRTIVITEGELDCLSVATAFDGKYPVVSIKGGASAAKKEVATHLEYLSGYDEIFLWFDNDEAGLKAVEEVVNILPIHKIRIVNNPNYKDASELLKAEGVPAIMKAYYGASKYKPDDIVTPMDVIDEACAPVEFGIPWCYEGLNNHLFGRRLGEIVVVGAGVAVGKTDFVCSMIAEDLKVDHKVCTFMLEQSTRETALRVAGKMTGQLLHMPDCTVRDEDKRAAIEDMEDKLFMFNSFGSNDWKTISKKIRYMRHNYDCRFFYIDNLTALNAHAQDERRNLDALMAEVAGIALELDVWILVVSHCNPAKNGPQHESGGKVEGAQLTGSRSIMRWAQTILGVERNTQHSCPLERNKGLIRIIKDRFSGAQGNTMGFQYIKETGLVAELPGFNSISLDDDDDGDLEDETAKGRTNNDF